MPNNNQLPEGTKLIEIDASLFYTGAKNCLLINCIRDLIEPQDPTMEKTAEVIMNLARENGASFIDDGVEKFIIQIGMPGETQNPSTKEDIINLLLMAKSIINRI